MLHAAFTACPGKMLTSAVVGEAHNSQSANVFEALIMMLHLGEAAAESVDAAQMPLRCFPTASHFKHLKLIPNQFWLFFFFLGHT